MKKIIVSLSFILTSIAASAQTSIVSTNAGLEALSTATASSVTRLGFNAIGDAPPLTYIASGSACTLNMGVGDNGSQVPSADGKCWLGDFPAGPIDVREFGADPTGTSDSTAEIQSAMNIGRPVYISGYFKFSTLTESAGGIIGDGEAYSYLTSTDTTSGNAITYSAVNIQPGTAAPVFKDFTLTGQSSKTAGAGLLVTAPSSENQGAQFTNITIYSFPTDLQFGAASSWAIQNSNFINYKIAGVSVKNTNNADSGDSTIMGSLFATSVGTSPVGIDYESSGGLKVVGNKFNGGAYGFFLGLTATSNTSDLLFSGNSVENQTVAAVELSRQSGTATFSNIVIVGDQFALIPNGIVSDASGAFSNVTIDGDSISLSPGNGSAVSLNAVSIFYIGALDIQGNGGSPSGVAISSSSSFGKIGKITYRGLATTLSNNSATTFYERDKEVITATVITNMAYGSLFTGGVSEAFPVPFTVTPEVNCRPSTGSGGGLSAVAIGITTTGFTAGAYGVTNGGSVAVICTAEGVI